MIQFNDPRVGNGMAGVDNFTMHTFFSYVCQRAGLLGTAVISNWVCFINIRQGQYYDANRAIHQAFHAFLVTDEKTFLVATPKTLPNHRLQQRRRKTPTHTINIQTVTVSVGELQVMTRGPSSDQREMIPPLFALVTARPSRHHL